MGNLDVYADPSGFGTTKSVRDEAERVVKLQGRADGLVAEYLRDIMFNDMRIPIDAENTVGEFYGHLPEEAQAEKRKTYEATLREMYGHENKVHQQGILDIVRSGGLATFTNSTLTLEQQDALDNNSFYTRTKEQAEYKYLQSMSDELILAYYNGEDVALDEGIDILMKEELWEPPSKMPEWYDVTEEVAMKLPRMAGSVYSAFHSSAAEMAPADIDIRSSGDLADDAKRRDMSAHMIQGGRIPDPKAFTAEAIKKRFSEMGGVNIPVMVKEIYNDPSKALDMLQKASDWMHLTAEHDAPDEHMRTYSHFLDKMRDEVYRRAGVSAEEELGITARPKDIEALTKLKAEDALSRHTLGFMIEYPHVTEAIATINIPSIPFARNLVKGGKAVYYGSKIGADEMMVKAGAEMLSNSKFGTATKIRVSEFLEKRPLVRSAIDDFVEAGETTADNLKKIRDSFSYQGWSKRLGPTKAARFMRIAAMYGQELMAGTVDEARKEMFRDVRILMKVGGKKDNEALMYLLDEPWAAAIVDSDIEEGYKLLIGRLLKTRIKADSAEDLVDRIVKFHSGKSSRAFSDGEKAALKNLSQKQKNRIADVFENPERYVSVPEPLREAYDAGLRLKKADQAMKELAGIMNVWRKVRVAKGTGARAIKVKPVKGAKARQTLDELKKTPKDKVRLKQVSAEVEAFEKSYAWVISRNAFRKSYVPRADYKKVKPDAVKLSPTLAHNRHRSALARSYSLEQAELNGLVMNPGKQWKEHLKSITGKYEAGSKMRKIDQLMRGERFVARFDVGDVEGAKAYAKKMGKMSDDALEASKEYTAKSTRASDEAELASEAIERLESKTAKTAMDEAEIKRLRGIIEQKTDEVLEATEASKKSLARHQLYGESAMVARATHAMRATAEKAMNLEKQLLEKETGVKWINIADRSNMNDQAYREYLRVTSDVGDTFDSAVVLAPESYAAHIEDMLPFIGGGMRKLQEGVDAFNALGDMTWRPLQAAWRLGVTIPRLAFSSRNFISSAGLGYVALGARAFDPALQANALAAAMLSATGSPLSKEIAATIPFYLKDGTEKTLADVMDIAKKLRLTSQLESYVGMGGGKNFLDVIPLTMSKALEGKGGAGAAALGALAGSAVPGVGTAAGAAAGFTAHHAANLSGNALAKSTAEAVQAVMQKASPAFHARWTENYQHLITFMGFLDDFSEKGIAKAFAKSSKWSGNYNLLSPAERFIFKDAVGFYAWHKFIVPHAVRMISERPEQLARVMRLRGNIDAYTGKDAMIPYDFKPGFLKGTAIGGHPKAHPGQYTVYPDVAYYSAAVVEDPVSLTIAYKPFIDFWRTHGGEGRNPIELLGPAIRLFMDVLQMTDEYGNPVSSYFARESFESSRDGLISRHFMTPVDSVSEPVKNILKLYTGERMEVTERLRSMVGRQWLGLDNKVARMVGYEPMSRGGMLDPGSGGMLGVSQYPVNIQEELNRVKSRGNRRASKIHDDRIHSIEKERGF